MKLPARYALPFRKKRVICNVIPCQSPTGGNPLESFYRPIRLAGTGFSHPSYGRVEVSYQGIWGTVCGDSWDVNDARVVCRQLGLPEEYAVPFHDAAEYGQGSGPILLDDVNCRGNESSIASCPSSGWRNHNCEHSQDAGVRCRKLNNFFNVPWSLYTDESS